MKLHATLKEAISLGGPTNGVVPVEKNTQILARTAIAKAIFRHNRTGAGRFKRRKTGIDFVLLLQAMFRIDDRMRNAGITLILAGLALIGAIGLDVTKKRQANNAITQAGIVTRQVTPIRFFSTVSTVLIILGIGATLVGKNEK